MLSTKGFALKPSVKPSRLRCLWLHFTAFDPDKKDWPRSQEPLNVAPKDKLCHGVDTNSIQDTIWTEGFM